MLELRRFAGPPSHAESIDELRVAHHTDLHVGRVTPYWVQRLAVQQTNESNPDLVVITGDFVCHSQLYLDQLEDVISRFNAPVLTVLGNHDYWSGANEVIRVIRKAGGEVLQNENTILTLRRQRIQVLGLDDAYTGHADRDAALKGIRKDIPTLGLSHIAEEADALWYGGVPLVLSGHTHAGQLTVAKLHEVAIGKLAGHKYVHGLYGERANDGAVYVGAGIGAAVFPFRAGERGKREITLFDLGYRPGDFEEPMEEQEPLPGRKPSRRKRYLREMKVASRELKRKRKNGSKGSR